MENTTLRHYSFDSFLLSVVLAVTLLLGAGISVLLNLCWLRQPVRVYINWSTDLWPVVTALVMAWNAILYVGQQRRALLPVWQWKNPISTSDRRLLLAVAIFSLPLTGFSAVQICRSQWEYAWQLPLHLSRALVALIPSVAAILRLCTASREKQS